MTTLCTYVLTTRAKAKSYAGIASSDTTQDTAIDELINGVTDFVQAYCGGRRFLSQAYVETYDTRKGSSKIFLRQFPVSAVTYVKTRSGTPSTPVWNTYSADSYLKYLAEGYLHFFGKFPETHQGIQVTYTAGYLIDFTNEFNTTLHTLPYDLTMAVNAIVSLTLKARVAQGVKAESTEGQSITYTDGFVMDNTVKETLDNYKARHYVV